MLLSEVKMVKAKHKIEVYPFSYNKIVGNIRKIDIRPYKKYLHNVGVGDMIEYINVETKDATIREVKGVALFDSFDTMLEMLPYKLIGYDNKNEIKVRIERMYTNGDEENGVMAIFIDEPKVKRLVKFRALDRSA